ncbi:secreted protein [Rhodopirellula europaea SH398]|uniref:Secreted protein n=2 Tax=Rhodopirellula europaea TaxID=1263866 RepID=M5RZY1_9BACT|nr:secreted protein [Rhodopirellula europaea 6C]EMI24850.1 secreted protein [Rhodopirellula europaea SH398]
MFRRLVLSAGLVLRCATFYLFRRASTTRRRFWAGRLALFQSIGWGAMCDMAYG